MDYTIQIGFNWNAWNKDKSYQGMSFVIVDGKGDQIGSSYDGSGSSSDSSGEDKYTLDGTGTLSWRIYDLTGDDKSRFLFDVQVPFTNKKTGKPLTPFPSAYTPPSGAESESVLPSIHLPVPGGARANSSKYRQWIGPRLTFKNDNVDCTFTITLKISNSHDATATRTFSVDPEMIVGSGS